jgi:hypothetical protein
VDNIFEESMQQIAGESPDHKWCPMEDRGTVGMILPMIFIQKVMKGDSKPTINLEHKSSM